ncbi:MAG: archaeosortase/exosortase family protein [Candidatus Pacearchaeota archaeon]
MVKRFSQGFKDFLIKSVVFVILFILIQIATMNMAAKTLLPGEIKLFAMDDLAEAVFFVIILFLAFNKEKILKIKKYSVGIKERIVSLLLIILLFPVYFQYKRFMLANIEMVKESLWFFASVEYLILFIILFFLIILIFGFKFIKDFFKEYKKGLGVVVIGIIVVYNFIRQFQELWPYLSGFVSRVVYYMLNFIGTANLSFSGVLPILSFNGFIVKIAQTCSGIDSIFIFTSLYLGILTWDWKILNKKKAFWLFFIGVAGAFAMNIIRIFILILIGAYISRDFVLNVFHTNASAILFLIYFAVFWKLSYNWMKK